MKDMQAMIAEGGPAFPTQNDSHYYHGATLRDYFAAKAMQGLITNEYVTEDGSLTARFNGFDHAAQIAYKMADAMIKARGDV